jgi:hypothetical protein
MNFHNLYARGGSFGRKENAGSEFISPSSPAGLSSAAVVNKKKELKEGKALAGFGLTGHSGIHIQSGSTMGSVQEFMIYWTDRSSVSSRRWVSFG